MDKTYLTAILGVTLIVIFCGKFVFEEKLLTICAGIAVIITAIGSKKILPNNDK